MIAAAIPAQFSDCPTASVDPSDAEKPEEHPATFTKKSSAPYFPVLVEFETTRQPQDDFVSFFHPTAIRVYLVDGRQPYYFVLEA